jgi:hypothetical protein
MPGFAKYAAFVKAHREANPEIQNKEIQTRAAQALWKVVKDDPEKHQQMIFEFRTKTANRERKLMSYWNKALKTVPAKVPLSNSSQTTPSTSAQTAPSTSAQTTPSTSTSAQTAPSTSAQTAPSTSSQTTPSTSAQTTNLTMEKPSDEVQSETKGMQLQCFMSSIIFRAGADFFNNGGGTVLPYVC